MNACPAAPREVSFAAVNGRELQARPLKANWPDSFRWRLLA